MQNSDRQCYGKMFPPLWHVSDGGPSTGKVFGFQIDHPGIIIRRRAVTVDRLAWEACTSCPGYDGCYRLSMGTLLLEAGLARL